MSEVNKVEGTGYWQKNGAGPTLTEGAVWTAGAPLTSSASYEIPTGATITTIDYWWDDKYLGEWKDQVSVELYLESDTTTPLEVDVTTPSEGTVDITSHLFPADCTIYFRMKVATGGTLFDPPYIVEDQVIVNYQY